MYRDFIIIGGGRGRERGSSWQIVCIWEKMKYQQKTKLILYYCQ